MMNNYCVYKHTCPSGKVYIGITSKKPEYRWGNGNGYKNHIHFFNAIRKYGWDNIKHEVICKNLSKEEACNLEQELIAQYKSNQREFGYNKSSGGEHYQHSKETCKRISEMMMGKRKGQSLSEEHKQKISKNNGRYWKGKCLLDDTKQKLSESHKGKSFSEEHKQKIGKANQKPIMCIETNEIFSCALEAKEKLNLKSTSHIGSCCNNKRKTAQGYHWRYA